MRALIALLLALSSPALAAVEIVDGDRWHVGGEIFAAIQSDIEGGKRVKGKAPWQWAPESDAGPDVD
ncbi:hypothetical protein FFK22_037150 [Mycobacterium sp. KBS0706]|uniref:hypothetical protein n=1 Tax=Mycobacterium sp. KBS0706 TaxID=2578109 RepID=UPI00110F781D|nr:hypothetical protein [Mycobacterium sp. KBS0706]TSD83580.1 hypothetical protein FFK22_037150 [Mycobacterium sp. KBS0706]